jgi:hypothetical protein
MYVLAGLLALGFVCNLLIRPVASKNVMTPEQLAALDAASARTGIQDIGGGSSEPSPTWLVVAAWLAVGIPMAWGVWMTLQKAAPLIFR